MELMFSISVVSRRWLWCLEVKEEEEEEEFSWWNVHEYLRGRGRMVRSMISLSWSRSEEVLRMEASGIWGRVLGLSVLDRVVVGGLVARWVPLPMACSMR